MPHFLRVGRWTLKFEEIRVTTATTLNNSLWILHFYDMSHPSYSHSLQHEDTMSEIILSEITKNIQQNTKLHVV